MVSSEASPVTLICTVTLSPAASVPEDGLTVSEPSSDDGSKIDQETGPPFAVSVSVPWPSRVSSTVVVDRPSAPVSGAEALTLTLGDGVAVGSDGGGMEVGVSPGAVAEPDVALVLGPVGEAAPDVAPVLGPVAEAASDGDGPDPCRARAARVPLADGWPASGMPRRVAAPVVVAATPPARAVASGPSGPPPARHGVGGVRHDGQHHHGRGRRRDRPAGRAERQVSHPRKPEVPAQRWPRKTIDMERSRAMPHCRAVCGGVRTWIGGEVQHVGAEPGRRRDRLAETAETAETAGAADPGQRPEAVSGGAEAEQRAGGEGEQQRGL